MTERKAEIKRKTKETDISLVLNLDGKGEVQVETGIGFFDHMLTALAKHARFDLELKCDGDLYIDDHHTVEDCGIAFGEALDKALGERRGINRFGSAYAPLDESLARAVVDFSGRAFSSVNLSLDRDKIGELCSENLEHFIESMATNSKSCIHVDIIRGDNDHHRAEAGFKALALALRAAVMLDGVDSIPSTKGVL